MNSERRRSAFTLIEVLIVVVIMAVLAATIIPQFSSSTRDAQDSTVKFNAHTLRSQIELYKAHHLGKYPANSGDNANLKQLTGATNSSGTIGTTGASYPYGPYLDEIPANPFNNQKTVKSITTNGTAPTTGDGGTGWQYDEATGNIWPNHSGWSPTAATTTP
jgi:prepilin-type N-terminal cleavage/methylation domain-containing protein